MRRKEIKFYFPEMEHGTRAFLEDELGKWIAFEENFNSPSDVGYRVEIHENKEQSGIQCTIEIELRANRWWARESGRTLEVAVCHAIRSLKLMRPVQVQKCSL